MKTVGMKFGDNANGAGKAIKNLFGSAKKMIKEAGSVVDSAIGKAVHGEEETHGPHIEIADTIHLETKLSQTEVHGETSLPEEGRHTSWFNVED